MVGIRIKLLQSRENGRRAHEAAGDKKNADMHGYRAEYAIAMYKRYARDVSTLPPWDRYDCRTDRAGIHYDRAAMLKASRTLGHNRVCVIASNYLRT